VIALDARRIATLIRATGADAVQSHDLNANVEVSLAGRWTRRPAILDVHDVVAPGLGRRVLAGASALASVTIANSRATAATVSAGRVEVVNPGVDLTRFFPAPPDPIVRSHLAVHPERPIVGILGRVDRQKGIDTLVCAMSRMSGEAADAQLAVVGAPLMDEDFGREIRRRATARLGDRIRFVEPTDDVPAVMRALDVLVNASSFEPFGRTVLEAQACGVAVVGTAAGGIPEFVLDGINGLLVPPEDPVALATQLERLLTDAPLRARLGAQSARDASNISTERQADLLAGIIRSVITN